jgi:hypothetical protein
MQGLARGKLAAKAFILADQIEIVRAHKLT